MARARNIKPSFFTNEELVELPFSTRLLFIGLWTLADREGRLEDRPKRIKMAIFPADNIDVDAALGELESSRFLARYEVEGIKVIQVLNFTKHQNPHVKESPSALPSIDEHSASTVQASEEHCASHADSLIPDSLIPESREKEGSYVESMLPEQKSPPSGFSDLIPDDFAVTEQHREYARMHRLPKPEDHLLAFVNHHQAKGTRLANWDAEFRKWLARQKGYAQIDAANARAGPVSAGNSKHDERMRIAKEMCGGGDGRDSAPERVIEGQAERVD